jgi:hypothetical protein
MLHDQAVNVLRAKNSLPTVDAKTIEVEFKARMAVLEGSSVVDMPSSDIQPPQSNPVDGTAKRHRSPRPIQNGSIHPSGQKKHEPTMPVLSQQKAIELRLSTIDKSLLALGEPRRQRDKAHLRFVALQPCLICERTPSDPHHLRFAQPRALGRKTSD